MFSLSNHRFNFSFMYNPLVQLQALDKTLLSAFHQDFYVFVYCEQSLELTAKD